VDRESVEAAAAEAVRDFEPGSDVHAGAEYRKGLAEVMARRALGLAAERARAASSPA
jgi:CO/xanthine dehydrogenase FAD-binding subunit